MSEWKGRLKTTSPREPLESDPEKLGDILVEKGAEAVLDKMQPTEGAEVANAGQANVDYVASKVIKEATKTLQREEANTDPEVQSTAGGLAAQAQAVQAKKEEAKEGEPEHAAAGFVRDRIAHFQSRAAEGSQFVGPNPGGPAKHP